MPALEVSVVVPAYNAGAYIQECLESVLRQTHSPSEIVVCDDASTDETPHILRQFLPHIQVIRNECNVGVGESLNRAMARARGSLVAIVAADDFWDARHLEQLVGLLEKQHSAAVAFCPVQRVGLREGVWPLPHQIPCYDEPRFVLPELMRNNFVHPCGSLIRREVFERVGGFQEIPMVYRGRRVQAEDYDFFLRTAVHYPFVAARQPTAFYRWHGEQSSQHVVAQYVLAFRYRLRLLQNLESQGMPSAAMYQLRERATMAWCEYIERIWSERDLTGLRLMVRYGMQFHLFRPFTWRYVPRACLPRIAVRRLDSRSISPDTSK